MKVASDTRSSSRYLDEDALSVEYLVQDFLLFPLHIYCQRRQYLV
jgi:hypothetical protein